VIPGVEGGMHLAPGSEHNDGGVITENPKNRARMMEKRMQKMISAGPDLPKANLFAKAGARIGIIGYGSNRGPIAEAQDRLVKMGEPVNFLQMRTLWPFPDDDVKAFVEANDHVFIVENSYTGQLSRLIKVVVGPIEKLHDVRKYNGRPFRPIEIIDAVRMTAGARPMAGV
jgi:pyruvate ferredoxin oxidoreductase alpha subunit